MRQHQRKQGLRRALHWVLGLRWPVTLGAGLLGTQFLDRWNNGGAWVGAQEVGYIEKYALAENREAVLGSLIPDTPDFFYYHCLHYQVTGRVAEAEAMLDRWRNHVTAHADGRIAGISQRQMLLTYSDNPQRTLDYLRNQLGLNLDHGPPAQPGEQRYPSVLDPTLIDSDRLIDEAIQWNYSLTDQGRRQLAARLIDQANPNPDVLRSLVQTINHPGIDRLERLVIAELKMRPADERRFGDMAAHAHLTLEQLNAVRKGVAEVAEDQSMIAAVLHRLRPSDDVDVTQQLDAWVAYLDRVETFVETLSQAHNSLKAAVLYHRLVAERRRGTMDRERLLRYLKLPRRSSTIEPKFLERTPGQFVAELTADYGQLCLLPAVQDDEPLVRSWLHEFFKNEATFDALSGLLSRNYLQTVFVEAKLLGGVGNAESWYKKLTADERKALQSRIELTLTPANNELHRTDGGSSLEVDVKNVQQLVVRIYRINTDAYYRSGRGAINGAIDLDGLQANHQRTIEFAQPAIQRHREKIELPEITGRGVWVVDLVGGGQRSRALIKRGDLRWSIRAVGGAQQMQVVDEELKPAKMATLWLGGQEFKADDAGIIDIPYAAATTQRDAVLSDGVVAVATPFVHQAESYRLEAGFHVHRQQVQAGAQAEILIRPRLLANERAVGIDRLKDAVVTVSATDQEGTTTTKRFDGQSLSDIDAMRVQMRVPIRLATLTATVEGTVAVASTGQRVAFQAGRSWSMNAIDATDQWADLFLARDGESWVIEGRGRNGEPLKRQSVQVVLHSTHRIEPVQVTLQTDDQGQLQLGALKNVARLSAQMQSGITGSREWGFDSDTVAMPGLMHAVEGDSIDLPCDDPSVQRVASMRLFLLADNAVKADVSSNIKIDKGRLSIDGLAGGDYQWIDLNSGRSVRIRIAKGTRVGDWVYGGTRQLEAIPAKGVSIESIAVGKEGLKLRVAGATKATRVHVFGSRYVPETRAGSDLLIRQETPGAMAYGLPRSVYQSDRKLAEEYQYVLRRREAIKYAGSMLPQASLLLNPWETEITENYRQIAEGGEALSAEMPAPAAMPGLASGDSYLGDPSIATGGSNSLEFLPDEGLVATNLPVDEEGNLVLEAGIVGDASLLRVVVCDPLNTVERTVATALPALHARDRRLSLALNVDQPYARQQTVLIASKDQPLDLKSLGTARVQFYSTTDELFGLYRTLLNDGRWAEFSVLGRWHKLNDDEKQSHYGRLACHELHVFLKRKDAAFFDRVVRPILANKKEPSIVDRWLLDQPIDSVPLWAYDQLNAFERALLAKSQEASRTRVTREFEDLLVNRKTDPDQWRRRMAVALLGQSLEVERSELMLRESVVRGDEEAAKSQEAAFDGPFGGGGGGFGGPGGDTMSRNAPGEPSGGGKPSRDGADKFMELADRSGVRQALEEKRKLGRRESDDGAKAYFFQPDATKERLAQLFRPLAATAQWAESNYDHLRPIEQSPSLVPIDAFWLDWLRSDPQKPFVSKHLLSPTATRSEALLALALTDLPLDGSAAVPMIEGDAKFAPERPVVVVTEEIRKVGPVAEQPPVLVGQRYEVLQGDSSAQTEAAPEEFLVGVGYRGVVVLTNPSPKAQSVNVLWQVPAGSVALAGGRNTDNRMLALQPFATDRIEYHFYFPEKGGFEQYPACVTNDAQTLAMAEPTKFNVLEVPSKVDQTSWPYLAVNGSTQQIADYLKSANLRSLEWSLAAHRMRDKEAYEAIMSVLDSNQHFVQELWAYSVLHNDYPRLTQFVNHQDSFVQTCGPVLESKLLDIDPVSRRIAEHLEYAPLVTPRIHPLRTETEITNNRFMEQYRQLMTTIAYETSATADQQLALVYYLLLQNRIKEAIDRFALVPREATAMTMQHDYLTAVLCFHQMNYEQAGKIAEDYLQYPVPRWRERFDEIRSQLAQRERLLRGGSEREGSIPTGSILAQAADLSTLDRERQQDQNAALLPVVRLTSEGDRIVIEHRNVQRAKVQLYRVDLEMLFSFTPFVQQDMSQLAMIEPNRVEAIELQAEGGKTPWELPAELSKETLLVEVVGDGIRQTMLYYGNQLSTYVAEPFGQLQVLGSSDRKPVVGAYVKVYARHSDGSERFFKDGYTDLRGRFDYATISGPDSATVSRLAILVVGPEGGSTLHEVQPPAQ
jgi:hypothetical protein